MNLSTLLWDVLFGSIGLGYFIYGKKQSEPVPLICGILLMVFTYFVSNTIVLVTVGLAIIAIPYFIRM